ncbi:hypothetical protein J5N97_006872 [Dioscorea zingiberensis]|uniref:Pectinesterase inhibitor domain-containing protein n=1 Tax=Dioscorea zingiberensis TaxID=325984 RepID=A0A9D5HTZ7_9LILI|nr:hypothetical protein J5N97_006872 [Dioscorea zingiberensis]
MGLLKVSSILIIFTTTLLNPLTIMSMQQQEEQVTGFMTTDEDLISKTCNQTSYSDVCMSTLLSNSSTHNATVADLAAVSIIATTSHAINTTAIIAAMINGSGDDLDQCLNDCSVEYGDAVSELQEAVEALQRCDYETVNVKVSAAMTNSDTCEGGFEDEGESSPLTQRNEFFFKLCSNALAIVKLLG